MSHPPPVEVKYWCANDCRQEGCPGHALKMAMTPADTYSVWADGELREVFDEDRFHAMVDAWLGLPNREESGFLAAKHESALRDIMTKAESHGECVAMARAALIRADKP